MPYQLLLNLNQAAPSVTVEFIDANNHVVNPPIGATVTFHSDNPSVVAIASDPNNPLKGNITLPPPEDIPALISNVSAKVTVSVTGLNDSDGKPFQDQTIHADIVPPIQAVPPSIQIRIAQSA